MPTYEYACTNPDCGHRFSQVQSFTDESLTVCPECGGRLRKVFGNVGVVFKGSGFYRNDSRDEARVGSKSKRDGSAEKSGAAKKDSSSDAASGSSSDANSSGSSSSGSSSSGSSSSGSSPSEAGSSGSATSSGGSTGGAATSAKAAKASA